jgi:hypothetical protein
MNYSGTNADDLIIDSDGSDGPEMSTVSYRALVSVVALCQFGHSVEALARSEDDPRCDQATPALES